MPPSNLASLLRNTAGTLSRQLGAGLLQLATVALIARLVGPVGNGAFAVGMLIPTALSTFLTLGLPTANVFLVGSRRHSFYDAWSANLRAWLGLSVAGLLIGAFLINNYGHVAFPSIGSTLLWIALATYPPMLFLSLQLSLLQAEESFRHYNLAFVALPASQLLLSCLYLMLGGRRLEMLVLIQLVASLVSVAVALRFTLPKIRARARLNPRYLQPAVQFGAKAHLSNILSYVNHKTDLFLINLYLGAGSAGIYVVASQLTERLWLLSQGLSTTLLPRLASLEGEEAARRVLTPLLTRWMLALTLVGGGMLAAVAPLLLWAIFGNEFSGAAVVIQILVPGIALGSASRVIASDFSARGRPELNMYTSWVAVFANISGNLALLPVLGIAGSAIATSLAYTLNMILRCLMYRRITGVPLRECLILKPSDVKTLWSLLKVWKRRARG